MRKPINLLIVLYVFALALFVGFIGVYTSCEKEQPVRIIEKEFPEYKITMTLESVYSMAEDSGWVTLRATNDGIFDWIWLGDGFRKQDEYLFDIHCDHQETFLKSCYPFDSLWNSGKLRFYRKLVNGNLNCKTFGFESLDCNWDKVVKAAFSNGTQPDFIHVFAFGNGYGTGNSGIGVLGIGTGQPSSLDQCDYWFKLPLLNAHEDGHGFGLPHVFNPVNIMSQATNGGCELGTFYLPEHEIIILNYINSRIN